MVNLINLSSNLNISAIQCNPIALSAQSGCKMEHILFTHITASLTEKDHLLNPCKPDDSHRRVKKIKHVSINLSSAVQHGGHL